MPEETIRISLKDAATSNTQLSSYVSVSTAPGSFSLPSSRHGSQVYFWTEEWQRKERLADFDFLIGDTIESTDAEDLIRQLHEAVDAETGQD